MTDYLHTTLKKAAAGEQERKHPCGHFWQTGCSAQVAEIHSRRTVHHYFLLFI
eukprot:gene8388-25035_t